MNIYMIFITYIIHIIYIIFEFEEKIWQIMKQWVWRKHTA